jgi:hypothetical protein
MLLRLGVTVLLRETEIDAMDLKKDDTKHGFRC